MNTQQTTTYTNGSEGMSTLTEAKGGDGWSSWVVKLRPDGRFDVAVSSKAEKSERGIGKSIFSYVLDTAQEAIRMAESEASRYAYRMFQ